MTCGAYGRLRLHDILEVDNLFSHTLGSSKRASFTRRRRTTVVNRPLDPCCPSIEAAPISDANIVRLVAPKTSVRQSLAMTAPSGRLRRSVVPILVGDKYSKVTLRAEDFPRPVMCAGSIDDRKREAVAKLDDASAILRRAPRSAPQLRYTTAHEDPCNSSATLYCNDCSSQPSLHQPLHATATRGHRIGHVNDRVKLPGIEERYGNGLLDAWTPGPVELRINLPRPASKRIMSLNRQSFLVEQKVLQTGIMSQGCEADMDDGLLSVGSMTSLGSMTSWMTRAGVDPRYAFGLHSSGAVRVAKQTQRLLQAMSGEKEQLRKR
jgi:hypothetical protein